MGQPHIKNALQNAYLSGKLSHAYLFVGPRGSGKTSTARILAKMVNCESQESRVKSQEKEDPRLKTLATRDLKIPCNQCASCLSITDGSNLDLIEIDAASNRGIDDIRDLRERIKLAPSGSKKKVYIIDEVHMLTTEAFNALLKTLEEPPSHVLFILATTEPHKIPQTILSRVQRLDFNPAKAEDLFQALSNVIKSEKINADEDALKLISKKAEGSFRDALKLLDQLSSSSEKITLASVNEALKSGSMEDQLGLLELIALKDSKKALKFLIELSKKGLNVKEYLNSLLNTLREMVLIKNEITSDSKLGEITVNFSQSDLIKLINHLISAQEKLKYTSIPQMVLEVAVLESLSPVTADLNAERESSLDSGSQVARNDTEKSESVKTAPPDSKVPIQPIQEAVTDSPDIVIIKDKWNYILETVKPYNYSLEALLKHAKVISCDGVSVVLEVPYSFHQRILEAPKSRSLLESVLADVLGKEIKVSTILGARPVRVEEISNVEIAADDEIIKIASEIFNS